MALKEAKLVLIIALVFTLLGFWLWWPLGVLGILAILAILAFFRDPERKIPQDPRTIVSAADGKVIRVDELEEIHFTNKPMKRVAVFLSVLDVHVNRSPCKAKIVDTHHHAGEFLDARNPEIDIKNEALNWLLQTDHGNVVVRQIAGLIARRIVAWKTPGEELEKGQHFGMIKFGSRTDVYLPVDCEICVKEGDRVKGGETIIARFPEN